MKNVRINLKSVATVVACFAVSVMLFTGCDDDKSGNSTPGFTQFSFTGQTGSAVIDKSNRTITAVAECSTNLAVLTPEFKLSPAGATAKVGNKLQTSSESVVDFSLPVKYTIATADGEIEAEWTVTITHPGNCTGGDFLGEGYIEIGGNTYLLDFCSWTPSLSEGMTCKLTFRQIDNGMFDLGFFFNSMIEPPNGGLIPVEVASLYTEGHTGLIYTTYTDDLGEFPPIQVQVTFESKASATKIRIYEASGFLYRRSAEGELCEPNDFVFYWEGPIFSF
jgi:hypothetical protein